MAPLVPLSVRIVLAVTVPCPPTSLWHHPNPDVVQQRTTVGGHQTYALGK